MRQIHDLIEAIRNSSIPVLLLGETGCGKEVIAERIHARSMRAAQIFLRINCAGLSESVVESELFGHERGAFTGAVQAQRGVFESAHGGTLMLDEVAELPLRTQAKLLRVLESGEFSRLGSCESRRADVRIIAATHRGLHELMERGQFRRDLYYRLAGAELHIPPLRERRHEVLELARHFLERLAPASARAVRLDATAEAALLTHDWPGNVRELRNVIEYAVARCTDGVVRSELIELRRGPPQAPGSSPAAASPAAGSSPAASSAAAPSGAAPSTSPSAPSAGLRAKLERFERECICEALARAGQNQTRAARALGISRRALTEKLAKYAIERPRSQRPARPSALPPTPHGPSAAGADS
jgi:DNA-binding NtrC family response regulator